MPRYADHRDDGVGQHRSRRRKHQDAARATSSKNRGRTSACISLIRVHAELRQALRRARQLELENRLLRAEGMPDFVASAPSMQPVLELIARVGPSDANVLITGEHGTGKDIVARLLHAASPRARMPLVTVNAGGMPEGTFESEFFGHVKGAFTDARTDRIGRFELANGGTLFLDEIANVPSAPASQTSARA